MNIQLRLANYITRYAPSHKKVTAYLSKKKIENIESLLEGFWYDESLLCDMWMRSFLALGKGERDIRQKLYKKEFPKEMIEEKIAQFTEEIADWSTHSTQIDFQIRALLARGKSIRTISMELVGKYPYFHDEILEIIGSLDDADWLKKEVQKYKNKYNTQDPIQKQKFYAALMRKGFSYSAIKEAIAYPNL